MHPHTLHFTAAGHGSALTRTTRCTSALDGRTLPTHPPIHPRLAALSSHSFHHSFHHCITSHILSFISPRTTLHTTPRITLHTTPCPARRFVPPLTGAHRGAGRRGGTARWVGGRLGGRAGRHDQGGRRLGGRAGRHGQGGRGLGGRAVGWAGGWGIGRTGGRLLSFVVGHLPLLPFFLSSPPLCFRHSLPPFLFIPSLRSRSV